MNLSKTKGLHSWLFCKIFFQIHFILTFLAGKISPTAIYKNRILLLRLPFAKTKELHVWGLNFDMTSFSDLHHPCIPCGQIFLAIDMDILITITFCIAHTNLSKDQGIKCMSIDVWHDPFWFTSSSYSLRVNFFSNLHRHSNCSYFFVLPTQISKRSMVIWHFPKKNSKDMILIKNILK